MSFFLAVDPDAAVRSAVAEVLARVSTAVPATWLPPEKLHVTVLFLGDHRPDDGAALRAIAGATAPFTLTLVGAGTFETARAPSVLWLGIGGALPALTALQARAVAQLGALAPEPERTRPYTPHLTLARGKRPGHFADLLPTLEAWRSEPFLVDHLTLYESAHGRFTALDSAPLTGRAA